MKHNINESRNRRKQNNHRRANQQNAGFNKKFVLPPTGMNMIVSDRFKYILTKISEEGNRIAKDFIKQLEDKEKFFDMSYIDLTTRFDTLSYLPGGGSHLPETEKFTSNKRQHSKVYKVVKTIFGSRYTKTDVTKFVSMYKSIYSKGPDKKDIPKPTDEQIIKKIQIDTTRDILKWNIVMNAAQWIKFEARVKATDKKGAAFILHIFKKNENIKEQETWSFMTTNFYNDNEKEKEKKLIPIENYKYEEIKDFLKDFIAIYKVTL